MTNSEKLASVNAMLQNAYAALEQLTTGAQTSASIGEANFSYETRSELLYFINQLENKKAALEGRQFKPRQTFEDLGHE